MMSFHGNDFSDDEMGFVVKIAGSEILHQPV
jgi:hypothetical protein